MTLYRETPCEVCGLKPWQSVYAFRSPGVAHLLPSDDPTKLGEPCPGSGGSRERVTIDYNAARGTAFRLRHRFAAGQFAEVSVAIVDAALDEVE